MESDDAEESQEESIGESEGLQSIVWKEPINGKTAFFTEEVYLQLVGPEPSLEEKVSQMMDVLGFTPAAKSFSGSAQLKTTTFATSANKSGNTEDVSNLKSTQPQSNSIQVNEEQAVLESGKEEKLPALQEKPVAEVEKICKTEVQETGNDEIKEESISAVPSVIPDTPASPEPQDFITDLQVLTKEVPTIVPLDPVEKADNDAVPVAGNPLSGGTAESDSGSQGDHLSIPIRSESHNGSVASENLTVTQISLSGAPFQAQNKKMAKGKRLSAGMPKLPEARKSSLAHKKHIRYLELFKKYCKQKFFSGAAQSLSKREVNELKEFENLQVQVCKEQEECQTYLSQVAHQHPQLYIHVAPHIVRYTQQKEEKSWQKAETYCRYYTQTCRLPLMFPVQPSFIPPTFRLVQTFLQIGSKCKLVVPDLTQNPNAKGKQTVPTAGQKVITRFPPTYISAQSKPSSDTWNHEPASKDCNMESLVQRHLCHIATSGSVVQRLLKTNPSDYSTVWDIPVVVREYGNGSASRKVVFLDKPLFPKRRSENQRKVEYLQKALRAFVCQPNNSSSKKASSGRGQSHGFESATATVSDHQQMVVSEEEDPFGASVSMEDLETFGSNWQSPRASTKTGTSFKSNTSRKAATGLDTDQESKAFLNEVRNKTKAVAPPVADVNSKVMADVAGSSKAGISGQEKSEMRTEDQSVVEFQNSSDHVVEDGPAPAHGNVAEKRCLRSSSSLFQENCSDSDEDNGLVIELNDSPWKDAAGQNEPQSTAKRKKESKPSIFDDVSIAAVANTEEMSCESEATPRRITRSTSQKLVSPTPAASVAKATRQLSKRRQQDSKMASEHSEPESCVAVAGTASSAKKGRKTSVESDVHAADSPASPEKIATLPSDVKKSTSNTVSEVPADGTTISETDGKAVKKDVNKAIGTKQTTRTGTKDGHNQHPVKETPLDSILKEMMPGGDSSTLKLEEDPSKFSQPDCPADHVGYHLWDLSGVAVLVRCNDHAFSRDFRQQQKSVYVMAKPEYQISHGLEQVTLNESIHAWLGCLLRPNSYLLRVRVNMQNYEVVNTEELQLNQILQPALNFSPEIAFAVMRNIFTTLMELPAGSYLLSHEANADHLQIKSGTNVKRGGYDFHCHYMLLGVSKEVDKSVPWVPVDPTLMLPHHWRLGLIPATFQPPDYDPKRKWQQQALPPKKKFRNKKKKHN